MKHKHGLTVLLTAALVAVSGMALADTEYLEHGRISFDTGGLLVKGAQDTEWAAAAVNALIVPGDTLWVDEEGTAELEMAGANFLRFADRSKAEIVAMPPDMFIRGWVGSFYVHRFARSEGTYIFAAPAATVDIARDSMVRLDIAENGSLTVSVRWGSAAVHTDLGGDVTATEGTRVWVDPGYMPSDAVAFDKNVGDAFDDWNSERARLLAESAQTTPKEVVVQNTTVGIYDLPRYGEWVTIDHRPYWRPTVVVDYEPYRHGYWNYMPAYGHVWVDEYPFAYVTSHYGRWRYAPTYGWVWSYDPVWGPAWVASVRAGDYFMWAPVDYYHRPVLVPGAATFMMAGLTFSWFGTCYSHADHLYWGPGYMHRPEHDWIGRLGGMPSRDISIWDIGFRGDRRPDIPFGPEFRDRRRGFEPTRSIRGLPEPIMAGLSPMDRAGRLESRLGRGGFDISGPGQPNPVRTATLRDRPGAGLRQVNLRQTEQAYLPPQQPGGQATARASGFIPESQRLSRVRELAGTRGSVRSGQDALRSGAGAGPSAEPRSLGGGVRSNRTPAASIPRTDMAVRDLESSTPAPRGSGQITRTPVRPQSVTRSITGGSGPSTGARSPATSGIRTAPTTAPVQRRGTSVPSLRSSGGGSSRAPSISMPSPRSSSGGSSRAPSISMPSPRSSSGGSSRAPSISMPSPRSSSGGSSRAPSISMPSPRSSSGGSSRAPSISMPSPRSSSGGSSRAPSISMPSPRSSSGGSSRAPSISMPSPRSSSSRSSGMPSLRSSGGGSSRAPSISAPSRGSAPSFSPRSGGGPSVRRGR